MECNCKNASDCLEIPRKCPSGCAMGYTEKNYGCEKNEVTPASTLDHERSTTAATTSPPVEPTNACSGGYYKDGQSCTPCGAGCRSTCNTANGHCSCKAGWTGYGCNTCSGGYYKDGQSCTPCGAGCRSTCNTANGHCSCKAGWTGYGCNTCSGGYYKDGQSCTPCGAGCRSTCNTANGHCSCKAGWTGYGCNTCSGGYYKDGQSCTPCGAGCRSTCNTANGHCSCKAGWTGYGCNTCSGGYYKDGQSCTPCGAGCRSTCNTANGHCSCKARWTGNGCNTCSGGYYKDGQSCTPCGAGCRSTCNTANGHCSCKARWTGNGCNTCSGGYYKDGQSCTPCGAGCRSTCNTANGHCSCKARWTENGCNTCSGGYYKDGQSCTPCGAGCRSTCNTANGHCSCKAGWTGNGCNTCSGGYYKDGQSCTPCGAGCRSTCNTANGHCSCKARWTGYGCNTCSGGYYKDGQSCTPCGAGCRSTCNTANGHCSCKAGWTGNGCNTCSGGYYKDGQSCTPCGAGCRSTCNTANGHCSCKAGWTENGCNTCSGGYYKDGQSCTPCGAGCRSTCNTANGHCSCKAGWTGNGCNTCSGGYYKDGQSCTPCGAGCRSTCNTANGHCSCKAGWTGYGCNICSPWTYGINCVLKCSRGCVNQTCDRTTGRCDMCLDGWEHKDQNISRCDKECDDGRYGEQCNDECSIHCANATCHHVNGSCTQGCLDGRSGEYCEVSEAEHQGVNLIVGLVLLLIAVIAVVICAVVYFREPLRRLRGKKTGEDMTNGLSFPMAAREGQGASENGAVNDDDEAIYINVPRSVPVAVSDLKDFVAKKKATKEILVKEYAELPKGLTAIHDKALTQVNSPKNRFKGIYPYNHSLVVLKGPSGSSGYINASFIDGPTRGKKYIATQGPLPHTVVDFWEMIWQQNVPVIVMLANIIEDGRRRCEPYWPNEPGEDSKTFGPWKITVADSCPLADLTIRTLKMRKGAVEKTVKHVHYMVWPDKDVPDNTMSLVDLRNKVRTFCDFAEGPMVVHCSAGVGRTGTLIALDSLIQDAETRSKVDIYGCVWRLRNFRVSMVQTQSQYVFLHDCILDALCHTVHPTPASFYDNAYKQLKGGSGIAVAYQKLSECPVTDHLSDAARDLENINKNRSEEILPGDKHRAILSTHIAGGTDYINAVIAPSYEKREAFILTQIPLTSTVVDFWRLVHDYDIRGIVLLENYTDLDAKCGVFWAKDNKPAKFGPFSVGEGKTEKQTGFTMEKISYSLGTEEKDVTVFRSSAWPQKSSLPESPSSLLSLIDFLRQWNTGTSPLLVVCSDGATRSGLFCVVASAVQRLLLEKEVALQQTIRSIRFVRKQVIPNQEQFEFCFDSVKVYMDRFQEYSNFA
ncbi:uncharacterized protein LOC124122701 isoform X2 [Haliotis rufescens]|uniref:uncharacterized protein LOC124122701 isoform X2 n=1 Tax=Haliotis rufescens TaxID=6454 RepID=UPI00201E8137|nr:uncharacterized protein LOC124122701 isoform X2 [Haliotis rufescens]